MLINLDTLTIIIAAHWILLLFRCSLVPKKFMVSKYIRDALPWEKKENLARPVDHYLFNEFDTPGDPLLVAFCQTGLTLVNILWAFYHEIINLN